MSELKWNWVYYPYLDAPNKQEESALKAGYIKVVIKDEADKVIADLIEKNKRLANKDIIMASETIKGVLDALRRHKYKRCLAMAWWCSAELGMLVSTWEFKIKHYKKWQKRWLKLADKFKEDV